MLDEELAVLVRWIRRLLLTGVALTVLFFVGTFIWVAFSH